MLVLWAKLWQLDQGKYEFHQSGCEQKGRLCILSVCPRDVFKASLPDSSLRLGDRERLVACQSDGGANSFGLGQRAAVTQASLQRRDELLERVGIGARRRRAFPHELSGGMRQRLAIALAIALEPPLLIADEPTTSLDVAVAGQVMAELSGLCAEMGSALLLISHDLAMAARWCERMAMLDGGRKVEDGPSQQLLTQPRSEVGKRLVASARAREGGQTPSMPMPPHLARPPRQPRPLPPVPAAPAVSQMWRKPPQ